MIVHALPGREHAFHIASSLNAYQLNGVFDMIRLITEFSGDACRCLIKKEKRVLSDFWA